MSKAAQKTPDASEGGKARAKKLSPERRQEIAKKAAEKRWGPPKAITEGTLKIGEAEIPCAVIEGDIRVISQRGMSAALGRHVTGSGSSKAGSDQALDGVAKLPNFLKAANLKQFIDIDLAASLSEPIEYTPVHGGRTAYGFKAELFPRICDVWLRAKDAKDVLTDRQQETAHAAYMLMRGLAHVGIIALVDEATGFQDDRTRDALAKILEAFVAKEIQDYVKAFPLRYFKGLCRLRGVAFSPSMKLPRYFGHLTNDIVYSRLAPAVLAEIRQKNPSINGRRKFKNYNWLTPEIGHPKLMQHLGSVCTLQELADTNWDEFMRLLNKVHPVYQDLPLFEGIEEG
jgi:P63C domain